MRMTLVLLLVALTSALGVVHTKYRVRMLFAEVQRLEQALERDHEDFDRLQLEEKVWAEHSRIEREARIRLGMIPPPLESTLYIKP